MIITFYFIVTTCFAATTYPTSLFTIGDNTLGPFCATEGSTFTSSGSYWTNSSILVSGKTTSQLMVHDIGDQCLQTAVPFIQHYNTIEIGVG